MAEQEKEIIVWKNPNPDWIKQVLNTIELRFVYDSTTNNLYCWNAYIITHMPVMNEINIDGDIIGTLSKDNIQIWESISPSDDFDEAIEITKQKFGKWLQKIYPNYDSIDWSPNY